MTKQYYSCKIDRLEQLVRFPSDCIRWINFPGDFPLVKRYYEDTFNIEIKLADYCDDEDWKFCALFEGDRIASFAGVLCMTEINWELGAVSTHPQFRNRGYATMLCSYMAKYILEEGKQVTCTTDIDNHSMQKVMRKIGMVMQ